MASRRTVIGTLCLSVLLVACAASRRPEEVTPDGLTRMPSRTNAGVFREAGWPFIQYKRFVLEPLTVAFYDGWEREHKDVSEREIKRIREEAATIFREQFERELVEEAGYKFAIEPEADVLIVAPTITELDIVAPETENMRVQALSPRSISMRITGDLRDAASGRLIGRVDMYSPPKEYGLRELRPVNRSTNAHEMSQAIRQWTLVFREALNVAKNEKKETKLE